MVASVWGIVGRNGSRDEDGHRSYEVKHLVATTSNNDGPATVMVASGLPLVGAYWDYGNDLDGWAWCLPTRKVDFYGNYENRPVFWWMVTSYFSTKRDSKRCQDESIEDPLLEPDRISGSFVKYQREVCKDMDGKFIKSSSHELYRGSQVEFDHNFPTVTIEQNVGSLELDLFSSMVDRVNDSPMWGMGPRQIKLSNASWRRELYGICNFYYVRSFEFDINADGFDREVLDEGSMVLRGKWERGGVEPDYTWDYVVDENANPNNPKDFIRYKDKNDENSRTPLNGSGEPLGDADNPVFLPVNYYREANLLLLGIPATLG